MLINLCANYLDTKVKCDKPSTDGYEISNLLTNNSAGFLAYSTIKPPINIDFDFICNIRLSHVLIWSCVGSQKSTGFKLSTRYKHRELHNLLSSGFLDAHHTGIQFSTKYTNDNKPMVISERLLDATINNYHNNMVDHIDNLRITIVKTDKSVPAISKIEIWGYISTFNNQFNNANKILDLLSKHNNLMHQTTTPIESCDDEKIITSSSTQSCESLAIPEEYLDPITWTLMIQPIILPSGKIIDQSTLENYGENEALWGRQLSDPFTGIMLSDNYKPIFASQLKLKIDKFLSQNANDSEIKQIPRILGYRNHFNTPSYFTHDRQRIFNNKSKQQQLVDTSSDILLNKINCSNKNSIHKLPIVSRNFSRTTLSKNMNKVSKNASTITKTTVLKLVDSNDTLKINCKIDEKLKDNLQYVLSNLKRFNDIKIEDKNAIIEKHVCNCCEYPIFYKLPCNHIICRKIILLNNSNSNNNDKKMNLQCPECNLNYKSSEIIKFHS